MGVHVHIVGTNGKDGALQHGVVFHRHINNFRSHIKISRRKSHEWVHGEFPRLVIYNTRRYVRQPCWAGTLIALVTNDEQERRQGRLLFQDKIEDKCFIMCLNSVVWVDLFSPEVYYCIFTQTENQ